MKRGLLLYNPEATSVSPAVRDVIAHAFASEIELEVTGTKMRHHATHIARGAVHEGFDLVISLGGDGTLNEVINGVAGSSVPVVPLPGGGTNVFARTMGLPRDAIEATSVVLERIVRGEPARRIPLGMVGDRYFGFCAGIGFDATVVERVERSPAMKRRFGDLWFIGQAVRAFYLDYPRKTARMTLYAEHRTVGSVMQVIVCNSDPYTYLGSRPFRLVPRASHENALAVMAVTSLRTVGTLRTVFRAFGRARHDRLRPVVMLDDVASMKIESSRPMPFQVDGDYAGTETSFVFRAVPDALSVIC